MAEEEKDGEEDDDKLRYVWVRRTAADLVAGTVAGAASSLVGYPFETVKLAVRQENRPDSPRTVGEAWAFVKRVSARLLFGYEPAPKSALDVTRELVRKGGWAGLYDGAASPVAFGGLQKSVQFCAFAGALELTRTVAQGHHVVLAGLSAGVANCFVSTPVAQAKVDRQLGKSISTPSFRRWYGSMPSAALLCGVYYPLYFSLYEGFKKGPLWNLFLGGLTGTLVTLLTFPLDAVRTTAMVRVSHGQGAFESPFALAADAWKLASPKQHPLRLFYLGLAPALLRAFPMHATVFFVFGALRPPLGLVLGLCPDDHDNPS